MSSPKTHRHVVGVSFQHFLQTRVYTVVKMKDFLPCPAGKIFSLVVQLFRCCVSLHSQLLFSLPLLQSNGHPLLRENPTSASSTELSTFPMVLSQHAVVVFLEVQCHPQHLSLLEHTPHPTLAWITCSASSSTSPVGNSTGCLGSGSSVFSSMEGRGALNVPITFSVFCFDHGDCVNACTTSPLHA